MKEEPKTVAEAKDDVAAYEAKLKKQHGEVTKITIEHKDKDKKKLVAYLREPTLAEFDVALHLSQSSKVGGTIQLFRTIHVGGDPELLELVDTRTKYAIAVSREVEKMVIPNVETTSKEL